MTSRSHNVRGTLELAIPCERFDVVFEDDKQNENGENLLVIPCYLKPSSGVLVFFDDAEQTPPHLHSVLRPPKRKQDYHILWKQKISEICTRVSQPHLTDH